MVENVVEWFRGIPEELIVFIISLLPILELRGGLIAASLLGVDWVVAFPICLIGNMLPIPFVLLLFDKIIALLKKTKLLGKLAERLENKVAKSSQKLDKAKFWGLLTFVGIPLPGTGGWTGAMVAATIRMEKKKAYPAIFLGIVLAGIIMSVLAYFIPGLFGFSF